MEELPKPWRDLEGYSEARLNEAVSEAIMALKFLNEGLLRNAAGKAFQSFKSLLAGLAARRRDELVKKYPGIKRLGRRVITEADSLILYMPTGRLTEVSEYLGLRDYSMKALALHQYQYNGLDREGLMSIYSRRDDVVRDICDLVSKIAELTGSRELRAEYERTCGVFQSHS